MSIRHVVVLSVNPDTSCEPSQEVRARECCPLSLYVKCLFGRACDVEVVGPRSPVGALMAQDLVLRLGVRGGHENVHEMSEGLVDACRLGCHGGSALQLVQRAIQRR